MKNRMYRRCFLALSFCAALTGCDEVEDLIDMLPEYADASPGEADDRAVTLVEAATRPSAVATAGSRLAWVANDQVWVSDLDGGSAQLVSDAKNGLFYAIAVDDAAVYWNISTRKEVYRGTEVIAELDHGAETMVVDDQHLYLADQVALATDPTGSVKRIDKDTGEVTVIADQLFAPWGVAVNATHVYFADKTLETIFRATKDGAQQEELATGVHQPTYVTLTDSHVYFGTGVDLDEPPDPTASKVYRIPLEGGDLEWIADNSGDGVGVMAIDDTHVYWAVGGSGIWRAPAAGGTSSKFVLANSEAMAIADGRGFWTDDRREDADDAIRSATAN